MRDIMISVVMPAYNTELYIAEAIDSILKQTHDNFEFIIVEDSSSDSTWSIIQGFAEQDARIKPFQVQLKNAGLVRNFGVAQGSSDYIAFMDSDDIAHDNRLEKQLAYMVDHLDVVAVGSWMQLMTSDGQKMNILKNQPSTPEEFHNLDRTRNLISLYGANTMVRRDAFDRVGGFLTEGPIKEIHGTEDGELRDRLAEEGICLALPEVLIDYRQHTESLSSVNASNKHKAHRFIQMRNLARQRGETLTLSEFIGYYNNLSSFVHFGINMRTKSEKAAKNARIYRATKNYSAMLICYAQAIVYHPMRFINRFIHGEDPSVWRI